MATAPLADFVTLASPALMRAEGWETEGRTWRWEIEIGLGDPGGDDYRPLAATGVTGTCEIRDSVGGSIIATPTVTVTEGMVTISLSQAQTAGLAAGGNPRQCVWSCELTHAASSTSVQLWAPNLSPFKIESED